MSLLRGPNPQSRLPRILKTLAKQRAVLISGKLDSLVPHTRFLEDALSQLETISSDAGKPPDPKIATLFDECKSAAAENLALLEASRRGVQAARDQIQSITEAIEQLSTYSGTGERVNLIKSAPRLEKRS